MIESSTSTSICFAEIVRLLCTHKPIDPNVYYPKVSWLKDGEYYFPDGIKEWETTIDNTTVALDILLTKKDFESKNVGYQCLLLRKNFTKESSMEVQLDPPGKLYRC